jgi:3-phosphoshikimate 1-carboxyvinyltransferase
VLALQNELKKLGASLVEVQTNHKYEVRGDFSSVSTIEPIETYDDHRMAMAFAPVAMQKEITLLDPSVVNKSYPSFWKHVSTLITSKL